MKAFIQSIGLQAPGLEGWQVSQAVLRGERAYQSKIGRASCRERVCTTV